MENHALSIVRRPRTLTTKGGARIGTRSAPRGNRFPGAIRSTRTVRSTNTGWPISVWCRPRRRRSTVKRPLSSMDFKPPNCRRSRTRIGRDRGRRDPIFNSEVSVGRCADPPTLHLVGAINRHASGENVRRHVARNKPANTPRCLSIEAPAVSESGSTAASVDR